MDKDYKMINGVAFAEEKEGYIVLIGKEGLYELKATNFGWKGVYVLPGESSKIFKRFESKDEALRDVYRTDIQRRKTNDLEFSKAIHALFSEV